MTYNIPTFPNLYCADISHTLNLISLLLHVSIIIQSERKILKDNSSCAQAHFALNIKYNCAQMTKRQSDIDSMTEMHMYDALEAQNAFFFFALAFIHRVEESLWYIHFTTTSILQYYFEARLQSFRFLIFLRQRRAIIF